MLGRLPRRPLELPDGSESSTWSRLAGILPVAVLGLVGYVVILSSLAIRGELGRAIGFGTALIGFGFSAYLPIAKPTRSCLLRMVPFGSAVAMTFLMIPPDPIPADRSAGMAPVPRPNGRGVHVF